MVMKKFDVTVGVLTRNSEKTVKNCLMSIINSSFPKDRMQIIVVDNVSNDKTLEIVKEVLKASGIAHKILINERPGYIGRSRQMVVDNSDAEYVLWVDSDAIIDSNYIENQLHYIKQSDAAIVFPYAILAINTYSTLARMQGYAWSIASMNAIKTGKTPFLGALGSIMKINIIKECGGFSCKRLGAGEDLELILKVKSKGCKIAVNPYVKIYHYMKENWCDIITNLRFWKSMDRVASQKLKVASSFKRILTYTYLSIIAFSKFKDIACLIIPIYAILWSIIDLT